MAHGDAREEKWRWNKRMEWVTSKRHMTAEHRLARAVQTLQADARSSHASRRLNWRPRRFKWTRPFRPKTKSGFCACAITFQTQSTKVSEEPATSIYPEDLGRNFLRDFGINLPDNTVSAYSNVHPRDSPQDLSQCATICTCNSCWFG